METGPRSGQDDSTGIRPIFSRAASHAARCPRCRRRPLARVGRPRATGEDPFAFGDAKFGRRHQHALAKQLREPLAAAEPGAARDLVGRQRRVDQHVAGALEPHVLDELGRRHADFLLEAPQVALAHRGGWPRSRSRCGSRSARAAAAPTSGSTSRAQLAKGPHRLRIALLDRPQQVAGDLLRGNVAGSTRNMSSTAANASVSPACSSTVVATRRPPRPGRPSSAADGRCMAASVGRSIPSTIQRA